MSSYEHNGPIETRSNDIGQIRIEELVRRSAVWLELSTNVHFHSVIHFKHTEPYQVQPADIGRKVPFRPRPTPKFSGNLFGVGKLWLIG